MAVMRFKRFTKVGVLKGIGRELLDRFFGRIGEGGNGKKLELPPASASDDEYFQGVAKALMSPEGLPDEVGEALYMVDEMSNDEGHERLHAAALEAGLKVEGDGHTRPELALEVFLADPKVLSVAHSEQKLVRLTSFEYYGGKGTRKITEANPDGSGRCALGNGGGTNGTAERNRQSTMANSRGQAAQGTNGTNEANGEDRGSTVADSQGWPAAPLSPALSLSDGERGKFRPPTVEVRQAMATGLDEWFAEHNRGKHTARVDVHPIEGEYYFIIRHGDTFIRTARVNEQKTEMLHFRPEKDDVVVYSPELDELRIHAGTRGERELYRREFGQRLFGDDDYFSQRKAYTLEPLRTSKADALDVEGAGGDLERVVLREYEVAFDNGFEEVLIKKARDIFAAAEEKPVKRDAIPTVGRLVRAMFELYFTGKKKPRRMQIRTPNAVKLGRHCDARVVQRWLSKQGFRTVESAEGRPPSELGVGSVEKRGWRLKVGERVITERLKAKG